MKPTLLFSDLRAALVLIPLLLAGCTTSTAPRASHVSTTVRTISHGQVIDGVPCLIEDLPVHHIHVHLQILADGVPITVPAGIGVGRPWGVDATGFIATGTCFAWIHTHDTTGGVHIVTPEEGSFTLNQLFEIWGQPLGKGSAMGYLGPVVVFVNGKPFNADPREVRLANLENIALELGRPPASPAPATYDFGTMTR